MISTSLFPSNPASNPALSWFDAGVSNRDWNDSHSASHLIFRWREALYALESLAVREVLPLPPVTPLHEMSPLFVGVTHLRDGYLPIANLERCLHASQNPISNALPAYAPLTGEPPIAPAPDGEVLIVLQREGALVGLVVSEVCDVKPIDADAIHFAAMTQQSAENAAGMGCVAGVARVDGQNLQLLYAPGIFDLLAPYGVLAAAGAKLSTVAEVETEAPLVAVVRLSGELFGIEVAVVGEFAPLRAITPVPRCPASVVGLMNLRGEVLTLLDIRAALQLPAAPLESEAAGASPSSPSPSAQQIVVVECDDWRVGVLVDEVIDIFGLPGNEIAPVSGAARGDCLSGTAWFEGKMLGVLDMPAVLGQERRKMEG